MEKIPQVNNPTHCDLVCILTAGRGTRMGLPFPYNKALLPLGERAALSLLLDKFAANSRFVIALGYCGEQVRDFLLATHPEKNFQFVEVKKSAGQGSGPGRSLLECEPFLREPFFFVASDTLWEEETPTDAKESWVGIPKKRPADLSCYCTVQGEDGWVSAITEKHPHPPVGSEPFIGLAYVHDPAPFFSGLSRASGPGEVQFSSGLLELIPHGLKKRKLTWTDLGTREKYEKAAARRERFNFGKTGEFLFFSPERVTKFFHEPSVVENRVKRAALNPEVFPQITFSGHQFYSYRFVPGKTLYEDFSMETFTRVLDWLSRNLWEKPDQPSNRFSQACREFYLDKTAERLQRWSNKYPDYAEPEKVNGVLQPSLRSLIVKIPRHEICAGVPRFVHGDLQPDNILLTDSGVLLLDWRQDFAGLLEEGDLYYDLAKLRGGLLLNYRLIKKGNFDYCESGESCNFSFPGVAQGDQALRSLDNFTRELGLDPRRLRILSGLIFANMAPLHHAPFDKLLWNLARETLSRELIQERSPNEISAVHSLL
jgi:thiamine kinase-like enzyme